jgi:Flp pilus assembly pilin Flp
MDDLGRLVGNGITSLVSTAFEAMGAAVRGVVGSLNAAIPFGLLPVVVFVVLLGAAWVLAKR